MEKKPIIVKKIKKVTGGHHGGAWKIAYADFVTAMMAFFLLMWLLGSTSQGDLTGIAEYFKTPLRVALMGGKSVGNTNSVINGGGGNITKSEGNTQLSENKSNTSLDAQNEKKTEIENLKKLKEKIETTIDSNPNLKQYQKQILIDITTEGLRIMVVDDQNRPMFKIGSSQVELYMHEILREIGGMLNGVPNSISISGHTDAKQYANQEGRYTNWELSSDRAQASRRELIYGGMNKEKVVRVVGLSSSVLYNKDDPFDPMNRRISIIVMNKDAEKRALQDGGEVEQTSK